MAWASSVARAQRGSSSSAVLLHVFLLLAERQYLCCKDWGSDGRPRWPESSSFQPTTDRRAHSRRSGFRELSEQPKPGNSFLAGTATSAQSCTCRGLPTWPQVQRQLGRGLKANFDPQVCPAPIRWQMNQSSELAELLAWDSKGPRWPPTSSPNAGKSHQKFGEQDQFAPGLLSVANSRPRWTPLVPSCPCTSMPAISYPRLSLGHTESAKVPKFHPKTK